MSKQNFKNSIDTRLSGLKADPYLAAKAKDIALSGRQEKKKPFFTRYKRVMFPVLSFAICVTLCISVAANMTSYFDAFKLRIGNEAASQISPVSKSVTDNGLQMEVLGIVTDKDSTDIYISLNDIGIGVVDENTKVYFDKADFSIFRPYNDMTFFDKENNTATYRVSFHNSNKRGKVENAALTMTDVLVGQEEIHISDIGINFNDLVPEAAYNNAITMGSSTIAHGADEKINRVVSDAFSNGAIKTVNTKLVIPPKNIPDWLIIENAGIIDGLLHIKYYIDGDLELHNNLSFEVYVDGKPYGRLMSSQTSISKPEPCLGSDVSRLNEAILEIPQGIENNRLSVALNGISYNELIKGDWTVSFEVDKKNNEKTSKQNLDFGEYKVSEVKISPISATVSGVCDSDIQNYNFNYDIRVILKDGEAAESYASSFSVDSTQADGHDLFSSKVIFPYPIDPDNIDYVIVGDNKIYF